MKTDWFKNNWNRPAQGVAAIAGAVLSFAQPPAEGIAIGDSQSILKLARVFIIPVVWLIMSVPARKFAKGKHTWAWFTFAIAMFVAAIVIWFAQRSLYESWTCHSSVLNKQFVVGDSFNPAVISGMQLNEKLLNGHEISEDEARRLLANTPKCTLVERAEQDPASVWSNSELLYRRKVMSILYIAGIPVFVVAMISALQGWFCAGKRA